MSTEKRVNLSVTRDGQLNITTEGYEGNECLKATAALEASLAGKSGLDRTFLPDYYKETTGNTQEQQVSW